MLNHVLCNNDNKLTDQIC